MVWHPEFSNSRRPLERTEGGGGVTRVQKLEPGERQNRRGRVCLTEGGATAETQLLSEVLPEAEREKQPGFSLLLLFNFLPVLPAGQTRAETY